MQFVKSLIVYCTMILLVAGAMNAQQAATSSATTIVPRLVNFSGKAPDAQGKPIAGVAGITFSIYKDRYEGAPLWIEMQNVNADAKGNYTVQLGATSAEGLPLDLFTSGEARWLGVRVNNNEEQPRVLLLSVPYALKAADAETVGGLPASAFMLAGTANAAAGQRTVAASLQSTAPPPSSSDVTTTGGTVNTLPLFTTATNVQSSILTQTGSGSTGKVGINTKAPFTTLDVHGNVSTNSAFAFSNVQQQSSPFEVYISAPASETLGLFTNGKEQVSIDPVGNASQVRTGGGMVKAMVYFSGLNSGRIVSCFNSTINGASASIPPCGFKFSKTEPGAYVIDFGFEVDDRFFSIADTGFNGFAICTDLNGGLKCAGASDSPTEVSVFSGVDTKFYLIVY